MRAHATIQDAMTSGSGIERTFHCGNPDHDDRNASASVNSLTGAFICYSCGWRGKIDVENFEIDVSEAGKELAKLVTHLEEKEKTLTESWLSQYDASGPGEYWLSRFSERTCREFRMGMDYKANHAVFPVRSLNGVPVGITRRNLTGEGAKYLYTKGVDISQYLFGYERCTDDVIILVEGATDAIAAWEVGHQAMAIYGSNISKAQRDAIVRYSPMALILAFDMDEAGDRAARDLAKYFPEYATTRPTWNLYKDLASMPRLHRKYILNAARTEILSQLAQTS